MAKWHRGALVVVHATLFVWASFSFGHAGAIRTALALHDLPGFTAEVTVVDGDATSLGGFYYLRPEADRVRGVAREKLSAHLQESPPSSGGIVVAVRERLATDSLATFGELVEVAVFTDPFDLQARHRRYAYRWR
ncbi:MAG: hypothetical protein ABIP94_01515 [Planctomycetota bacterium]